LKELLLKDMKLISM